MRKVVASLFLSLAGADEPEDFVTDVDDRHGGEPEGVSR
jgi:hypothetical protein